MKLSYKQFMNLCNQANKIIRDYFETTGGIEGLKQKLYGIIMSETNEISQEEIDLLISISSASAIIELIREVKHESIVD